LPRFDLYYSEQKTQAGAGAKIINLNTSNIGFDRLSAKQVTIERITITCALTDITSGLDIPDSQCTKAFVLILASSLMKVIKTMSTPTNNPYTPLLNAVENYPKSLILDVTSFNTFQIGTYANLAVACGAGGVQCDWTVQAEGFYMPINDNRVQM
jgi:hypothetical protein